MYLGYRLWLRQRRNRSPRGSDGSDGSDGHDVSLYRSERTDLWRTPRLSGPPYPSSSGRPSPRCLSSDCQTLYGTLDVYLRTDHLRLRDYEYRPQSDDLHDWRYDRHGPFRSQKSPS